METLYEKSSLILNPGVYDTGKVYCTKPFDGSGDLTFTRNSNATRIGPDGKLEKVRQNLILQSNSFNTTWAFSGTGTVTTGATDPFGGTTAWTLAKTAANTFLYQSTSSFSGSNTFSIYAKAGTVDQLWINHAQSGAFSSFFNLTLGTAFGEAGCVPTIVSVGGGWFRCSIAGTVTSPINLRIYPASGGSISGTTGSILIYAAQAETGDIATDYIPTTSAAVSVGPTANVPRLNYSNGCPSLLLEPQRTNYFLYNEQIDNAAWAKARTTVTANATTSPDGYQNADAVFVNSSTNTNHEIFQYTTGTTNGWSGFFKANGYDFVYLFGSADPIVWFDLQNGVVGTQQSGVSGKITSYGNGWYRCEYFKNSGTNSIWGFGIVAANGTATIGTPDTNKGVYFWGAQSEGTYATSYIGPTLGASVTRLADAFSLSSLQSNGIISSTGLSFFLNFRKRNLAGLAAKPALQSATGLDIIGISTTDTTLVSSVRIGGGSFINNTILSAYNNEMVKVCFTLSGTTLKVFLNGSLVKTTTASNSSVFSELTTTTSLDKDQEYQQILLFPTPLSDADAITLTTL